MAKRKFDPLRQKKMTENKIFLSAGGAFLFCVVLLYLAHLDFSVVVHKKNGDFYLSKFSFKEESFDNPRLRLLRQRENLDKVIAPGKTQFDKIVLLRDWTSRQWTASSTFYYPPWDAVEILDLARKHGNRAFCAQYAIVFLQACQAVGLHARYVDLPGHFVASVWSDDYDKWVVMDPSNNLHYEKKGQPLGEWELDNAYRRKAWRNIAKVAADGKKTSLSSGEEISVYRQYSILLRNNHLSQPVGVVRNGKKETLALQADYRGYPMVGRDKVTVIEDVCLTLHKPGDKESTGGSAVTQNPEDFKYVKNQTMMFFAGRQDDTATIKLVSEMDATFQAYQVRYGDNEWKTTTFDNISLNLKPGFNKVSARILTKFGWLGEESTISIFHKPSWLF